MVQSLFLSFFLINDLVSVEFDEATTALLIFNFAMLVNSRVEVRLKFCLFRLNLVLFTLDELYATLFEGQIIQTLLIFVLVFIFDSLQIALAVG